MMMKKITALSLVACAMLVVSVRESQAEEWPDVWDNGCSYTPSPEWTKFGDWCHSESGKSDHHDPDRADCKDFGGTSHPHWCIATPAAITDEQLMGHKEEKMELAAKLKSSLSFTNELQEDMKVQAEENESALKAADRHLGELQDSMEVLQRQVDEAAEAGCGPVGQLQGQGMVRGLFRGKAR
jgi:hypothetical protein